MKDFHVVLKNKEDKGLYAAAWGVIFFGVLAHAGLCAYFFVVSDPAELVFWLFAISPAIYFLAVGGSQLLYLDKKVHLVPQGIAVTLWGRTLVRYPIEEIGMFFVAEWWGKGWARVLGVSTHTPEEITQLREMQLQKGIFTRDELKFRKRVSNWQQIFRQEYIMKRARRVEALGIWKRDILWLELTPDNLAMLRYFYPEVSWEYLRREGDQIYVSEWKEKETTVFSRGRSNDLGTEEKISLGFLGFLSIPFFLFFLLLGGVQLLGVMILMVGAIVVLGVCIDRSSVDVFHLSDAGIRIMRGKQEHAAMFASDIRTMIKYEIGGATAAWGETAIVVSTASPEELIKRAVAAGENADSAVMTEIPGWEQRALFRFCTRLGRKARAKNADCQMLCWNLQREETLRRLYPDAEWIDLTPERIYSR